LLKNWFKKMLGSWIYLSKGNYYHTGTGDGKAIPVQAWTCPEVSRSLRFLGRKTIGT